MTAGNTPPILEYLYDGSFPGLLTVVFQSFNRKETPDAIIRPQGQRLLFASSVEVVTDSRLAQRVWSGITRVGKTQTCNQLYYAFLSQHHEVEMLIVKYCQELFRRNCTIATDLGNPIVLQIHKLDRKVLREAHRALMFIRFEQAADGTFFAPFAPKYDIIPLITGHFRSRFADQRWVIYDTQRDYGFLFNGAKLEQITISSPAFSRESGQLRQGSEHQGEDQWQELWRAFFRSIAIADRTNYTVQRNFMPKRFWRYLTEKKI